MYLAGNHELGRTTAFCAVFGEFYVPVTTRGWVPAGVEDPDQKISLKLETRTEKFP